LPPGPVERQHQVAPQSLAKRRFLDQSRQLWDHMVVSSVCEVGLDPVLVRGETHLLEPNPVGVGELVEHEVGERGPAPHGQRFTQHRGRADGVTVVEVAPTPPGEVGESVRVDGGRIHREDVSALALLDHVVRLVCQQPTQLRDLRLQRVRRTVGR
jgi:hypothetical protein